MLTKCISCKKMFVAQPTGNGGHERICKRCKKQDIEPDEPEKHEYQPVKKSKKVEREIHEFDVYEQITILIFLMEA